jgi:hypothetical protein
MEDFEKLGVFYLGREYDVAKRAPKQDLLLYASKDLTTHAVCVGMTGSGKTGLCLALLEEAAIDGIPAIALDPKGDIANLALSFPELRPDDFAPWMDKAEAERQAISVDQLAAKTADKWRDGLKQWGEDGARIKKFRDSVDLAIYTPGSNAGLPLTVLRSFDAPAPALLEDADAMRERVSGTVSGLLALAGVDSDPIQGREHILLSSILDDAWKQGRSLDLAGLLREIQNPSIKQVGFVDVETFYPAKQRFQLAMQLNNVLASPSFAGWMTGEPLDIGRLLYTPAGKPRLSILSIAHLSDSERMFFVTILLNELLAWTRTQSGTSSLRAIFYMDEVFGYFPPSATPPSKKPMLTLLKQARAFGVGIVLATQNPVDLDYKGLSNAGTWLLGRLQTERDKARVLDGLETASADTGAKFDRAQLNAALSALGNRIFLMNNVHDAHPVVFETRWTLSYLGGPLTREQIGRLMKDRKAAAQQTKTSPAPAADRTSTTEAAPTGDSPAPSASGKTRKPANSTKSPSASPVGAATGRPMLSPGITEVFVKANAPLDAALSLVYQPALLGVAKVHYVASKNNVDVWKDRTVLAVPNEQSTDVWGDAPGIIAEDATQSEPLDNAKYAALSGSLNDAKSYAKFAKALKEHLYRVDAITLFNCVAEKQFSKVGESEADFRARLSQSARERRDATIGKLQAEYASRIRTLQTKLDKVNEEAAEQKSAATAGALDTFVSFGGALLSAVLSNRKLASQENIRRAGSAMRSSAKVVRQRSQAIEAEGTADELQAEIDSLQAELKTKIAAFDASVRPDAFQLEPLRISPRKADIAVTQVALAWTPWTVDRAGDSQAAFTTS